MHILRNILPSTLGYHKVEYLVSINKPSMSKVELDAIHMSETRTNNWHSACQPVRTCLTMPISVGYILVQEFHEMEDVRGHTFKSYILSSHHYIK